MPPVVLSGYTLEPAWVAEIGMMVGPAGAQRAQETGNQSLIPNASTETPSPLPTILIVGLMVLVLFILLR